MAFLRPSLITTSRPLTVCNKTPDTITPPIKSVIYPIIAENSLALAIPKLNGNANKNTRNPDIATVLSLKI